MATDLVADAAALVTRAETLLVEVHQARVRLAAAPESPERTAYLPMLEAFERGLLAAFDGVVAELKTQRADIEGYVWLRRRLEVVSPLVWKREVAHSSGRLTTTCGPSCRTASGGTRHGRAYQHAADRG